MVFMPPRHSKSEHVSRKFPAWFIGKHPDKQIITGTYGSDLATDFGRDVREIIQDNRYQNVFPGVELRPDSTAANRWHTKDGGVYIAAGRGTAVTGRGADLFVLDDLLKDRQEADSERIREQAWNWYTSVVRTRLMPGGRIVYTTTRWHEDDPAGRLLNSRRADEWHVIEMPALRGDEALWPEWYPTEVLKRIRDDIPSRDWEALYQQNPTPQEGTFFKRDWFWRYDEAPKHARKYLTSDFAFTERDSADYTEVGIHGVADQDGEVRVYLGLDGYYGQEGSERWVEEYLNLVLRHRPICEFGESGISRRAAEGTLNRRRRERKAFGRIEWIPSISDKVARARALQAMASMGMVGIPNNEYGDRLLEQLVAFPAGRFDDAVDMCAMICRVIDEAHPGIARHAPRDKPMDRWDRAFARQETEESWRV